MQRRSQHLSEKPTILNPPIEENELRIQLNHSLALTEKNRVTENIPLRELFHIRPRYAYVSPELATEEHNVQIAESLDSEIRTP